MPTAPASGIVKFAKLLQFLEKPRTVPEIANHLEVEESTVYRYLRDLDTFGFVTKLATVARGVDKLGRHRKMAGYIRSTKATI
jgi:predicted transcriptional regulator